MEKIDLKEELKKSGFWVQECPNDRPEIWITMFDSLIFKIYNLAEWRVRSKTVESHFILEEALSWKGQILNAMKENKRTFHRPFQSSGVWFKTERRYRVYELDNNGKRRLVRMFEPGALAVVLTFGEPIEEIDPRECGFRLFSDEESFLRECEIFQ